MIISEKAVGTSYLRIVNSENIYVEQHPIQPQKLVETVKYASASQDGLLEEDSLPHVKKEEDKIDSENESFRWVFLNFHHNHSILFYIIIVIIIFLEMTNVPQKRVYHTKNVSLENSRKIQHLLIERSFVIYANKLLIQMMNLHSMNFYVKLQLLLLTRPVHSHVNFVMNHSRSN